MFQGKQFDMQQAGVYCEVVFQWPYAPWHERWRVDYVHGYTRTEIGRFATESEAEAVAQEAKEREREAEEAIAAFHAALDAEAADERRDEALWQAKQQRIEQEREAERRALFAACDGDDGPY
jgi:hypothetical protein